ncbi:MAG: OsmC family protein, partial [Casimicrobiaceae bacterium]
MKRNASAVWQGSIKTGKGTMSTESGVLSNAPYSFGTRFENEKGTNPEELIGAAHAGCFAMAFSLVLSEAGLTPERVATTAAVTIDKVADGFAITSVHLTLRAKIPGATRDAFERAAEAAKAGCP